VFNEKKVTLVYKLTMQNKNPLSPHLQIYKWHISSLLSITHRIVGVINFLIICIICLWAISLLFGPNSYEPIEIFFKSFIGKFFAVSLCWTFSFHIVNEIRHLFWDAGFGFDLKISRITGAIALITSFFLTILFFTMGKIIF
tara:strand:+ start:123 stop:548 length:426 start_codon:yes stop_codon:yes gene_type:complete